MAATAALAAVMALQCSTATLSLSSNSILGERFSPLKRWEREECKPNRHQMHVKVGDIVKIISGHEKGKIGEIARVFRHDSTVIVKDINLKTKHMKSREQGEPGQIVKIEAPIHSSKVMLYSKEKQVASRVGYKILEEGTKVRYLIKSGEIIDSSENWKRVIKERK